MALTSVPACDEASGDAASAPSPGHAEALSKLSGVWVATDDSGSEATFANGRFKRTFPKADAPPQEGPFEIVAVKGDTVEISWSLELKSGTVMRADNKLITFSGNDQIQVANATTGDGDTFKRK